MKIALGADHRGYNAKTHIKAVLGELGEEIMDFGTDSTKPDSIVLIPGLWMTALSWEHWVERFRARGFTTIAKSWPRSNAHSRSYLNRQCAWASTRSAVTRPGVSKIAHHCSHTTMKPARYSLRNC